VIGIAIGMQINKRASGGSEVVVIDELSFVEDGDDDDDDDDDGSEFSSVFFRSGMNLSAQIQHENLFEDLMHLLHFSM